VAKPGSSIALAAMLTGLLMMPAQANASQTPDAGATPRAPAVGYSAATGATQRGMFSTIRRVAKCAIHIGAFVAGNAVAINKLRKAGGVWKLAKEAWKAKGRAGKLKVLSSVFGELIGLNTVAEACGA
jgi:hypothetical protein